MCGLIGLFSPAVPIRSDWLDAMRDQLAHRGPDNASSWIHPGGRVALAHRRLSIIDLSHAADQPMVTADGKLRIVFNGEIYNYLELRSELEALGIRFITSSDTEVLLATLQVWEKSALLRLNGMFAFALWDERSRRMLIARDRFGEKPLFIGRGRRGTVAIASEMKAILAHPLMPCSASARAIERYATAGWHEDDHTTFFDGIERLPPAHAAWLGADGVEQRRWRYWTPDCDAVDDGIGPREAVERFSELVRRSIRMRLRADVPIGSSLSGGLDSSTIVGFVARERSSAAFMQNTFSACFPTDPTISEQREIDAVASYTGVNSFCTFPQPKQLAAESALLHWHQEEPFLSASIYAQWCVARLAQEHKTTVLLDGQGADELLAGYHTYFRLRQLDLLDSHRLGLALRETTKFTRRLVDAGCRFENPQRRINLRMAYSNELLLAFPSPPPPASCCRYETSTATARPGSRLRRALFESLLYNSLPMLLRYADRNSMAFSRETRLPFLDYDLVDFCLRLPDAFLIRNGWQKWILRQAAGSSIPASIRWRADKVGYAAPQDDWLRHELRDWGRDRVFGGSFGGVPGYDINALAALWDEHQAGTADHSWALWRWISLAEWLALYRAGWWRAEHSEQHQRIPPVLSMNDQGVERRGDDLQDMQRAHEDPAWIEAGHRRRSLRVHVGQALRLVPPSIRRLVPVLVRDLVRLWTSDAPARASHITDALPPPASAKRPAASAGNTPAQFFADPHTICILALSRIADDPRVRRQAEAFHRAGWKVVAVGIAGDSSSSPPEWPILTINNFLPTPVTSTAIGLPQAAASYWAIPDLMNIYRCGQRVNAAVWLANDWTMLPIAATLARATGGMYGYDTHEFAVEEYAQDPEWCRVNRPIVSAIEQQFISDAAVVSTVSDGIAERLDQLYRLARPTLVVRNTPYFEEVPFRTSDCDRIRILYHGIVVPNRGIETVIDSVPQWRPEITLTIRGPENPSLSPVLRERIAALGLEQRVELAPAVPMTALVREATSFDVGILALPGHSKHNEFALPNKFFEYVMAGLAVCTTDLPEMARLIRQYGLGVTFPSIDPEAIAAAVNTLDRDRINTCKRNALSAARELCWEHESRPLIHAYVAAVNQRLNRLVVGGGITHRLPN